MLDIFTLYVHKSQPLSSEFELAKRICDRKIRQDFRPGQFAVRKEEMRSFPPQVAVMHDDPDDEFWCVWNDRIKWIHKRRLQAFLGDANCVIDGEPMRISREKLTALRALQKAFW